MTTRNVVRKIKRGVKRMLSLERKFGGVQYYWVATLPAYPEKSQAETSKKGYEQAQTMAKRLRAKGETIKVTPYPRYTSQNTHYWCVWRKEH